MSAMPKQKAKPKSSARKTVNELSLTRLIPNLATVAALCTGLSAIRFAMMNHFQAAVIAILVAAFLDGIDGRIARLLKATSDFGAELDSLSDFVSFGVAPAIVTYLLTLHHLGGFGWGLTLFFSVCMGLRLARFNAMNIRQQQEQQPDQTLKQSPVIQAGPSKFFLGVPAPGGAFIALFPLMVHFAFDIQWILNPYIYAFFILGAGSLMVSRLPTYSFKSLTIKRQWMVPSLILAAIIVAIVVSAPWAVASIIVIAYLSSIPFSVLECRRFKIREVTKL
jgi:CDP-diacylglycerol--serine O-phosphatidyltransferase